MNKKTDVSCPYGDCYLRNDCDYGTSFICKTNDFCKYVPESPDKKTVTTDWYDFKINELQDWLLDKLTRADTSDIKRVYKEVLHKTIDMFTGANTDWDEIIKNMDEWM